MPIHEKLEFSFFQTASKVGTFCTINDARSYLYTSGYLPELQTNPGPQVPRPFETRMQSEEPKIDAARDILNLTQMN